MYDWLALDRTPAALDRWQRTTAHTMPAWIFATVFSSLAFAALHGSQDHWGKGPIILFVVSLMFCAVRIRTRSVAASMLVHMAYNGLLFLEMIFVTGGFRHLDKLH
jgi:membrane protease YdiL (CAAX protease family)